MNPRIPLQQPVTRGHQWPLGQIPVEGGRRRSSRARGPLRLHPYVMRLMWMARSNPHPRGCLSSSHRM